MKLNNLIVFQLVENLTKKDKEKFINKLENDNLLNSKDLFNSIVQLLEKGVSVSDIESYLKTVLSKKLIKNYRANKSTLKKEIISFMKDNLSLDMSQIIRDSIYEGKTLIQHHFLNEGLEIIENAKEKAIQEEAFEEVVFALNMLRQFDFSYRKNHKLAFKLNQEILKYQKLANNYSELMSLSFFIYSFQADVSVKSSTIEKMKDYTILSNENNALSLKAKKFYFLCWLDIYNALKDYKNMRLILEDAIIYAEKACKEKEVYSLTLLGFYERLEYVTYQLELYDESLEALDKIENFEVPKAYKDSLYVSRMTKILVKKKRVTTYGEIKHKELYPYCMELIGFLKNTKMNPTDKQGFYYSLFFILTTKLDKPKVVCSLFKDFIKYFNKNAENINPNDTQIIQVFLCYFISSYKLHNKEAFSIIAKKLYKNKNAKLFKSENAKFAYVFKLNEVFLKAYDIGFFEKETLKSYFSIWESIPDFLPKANCIPKTALASEYNESNIVSIKSTYKEKVFIC